MTVAPVPPAPSKPARLAGLDALRAAASLAVVMLHAAVAYTVYPLPDLLWSARDRASPLADALGWAIQGCVMPVFFVMSGFFACGLLAQRGRLAFAENRIRRLGLPLAAAMATILPLTCYVWVTGWIAAGRYPLLKLRSMKFEPEVENNLWGLAHLWYLEYLLLDCLLLASLAWLVSQGLKSRAGARLAEGLASIGARLRSHSGWLPLLFVVPSTLLLWTDLAIVIGFQHSLLPVPTKLCYHLLFFLAGVSARKISPDGSALASSSVVPLFGAGLLFCGILPSLHQHLVAPLEGLPRLGLATALVGYAWLMAWGLFRLALAWRGSVSDSVRYTAEASYWIYLIHLPVVGLAQVALGGTAAIPSEVKFALVTLVAWTFSLLTYQAFVRGRWLGTFLDGSPRRETPAPFQLTIYRGDEVGEPPEDGPLVEEAPAPENLPRREAA